MCNPMPLPPIDCGDKDPNCGDSSASIKSESPIRNSACMTLPSGPFMTPFYFGAKRLLVELNGASSVAHSEVGSECVVALGNSLNSHDVLLYRQFIGPNQKKTKSKAEEKAVLSKQYKKSVARCRRGLAINFRRSA